VDSKLVSSRLTFNMITAWRLVDYWRDYWKLLSR